jgi:uncharacterized membrane protein
MTADAEQAHRYRRAWHPPLTDFPIAAYVFAAAFDIISAIGGTRHGWAREFWHAGTFVLIGGAAICVLTVLTGFRDLLTFSGRGPVPVRTISVHVLLMVGVFMVGIADIAWRLSDYQNHASTPPGILACSLIAAVGVCVGASYGGTLVFREGFGMAIAAPGPAAAPAPGSAPNPGPNPNPNPGPANAAGTADAAAQSARHRARRSR